MTNNRNIDVIIIGGGPAGTKCALWINNLGYKVAIIEKQSKLGGLQSTSPYQNNCIITNQDLLGIEISTIIENNIKNTPIIVEKNSDIRSISQRHQNIYSNQSKF